MREENKAGLAKKLLVCVYSMSERAKSPGWKAVDYQAQETYDKSEVWKKQSIGSLKPSIPIVGWCIFHDLEQSCPSQLFSADPQSRIS